jgi:hypothetical protein
MSEKPKGQHKGRSRRLFPEDESLYTVPSTYSYPSQMLPTLPDEEERLDQKFASRYSDMVGHWECIDVLRRIMVEMRAQLDDSSNYRAAIDLLGAKAITDARSAYLLVKRGYALASLGPLRSGLEAVALMAYFRLNTAEVEAWRAEDPRFGSLGWIRKKLPEDPTPIYDFFAYGMHANWRFIPHLLSRGPSNERNFEIVPGPVRNETYTVLFALSSIHQALRALGELHQHQPDCVRQTWRDQYTDCANKSQQLLKDFAMKSTAAVETIKEMASHYRGDTSE